jgi:long-subunit fatty acid transport protein
MHTRILLSLLVVSLTLTTQAQFGYFNDALLFSRTYIGGSSRIQAMGGSQIALGGDISAASGNPAGLGFYNRSVFSVSPNLDFAEVNSQYFGSSTSNFNTRFNLPNMGVVFYYGKGDIVPDKFKGGSLGISVNRVNSFNRDIIYEGRNDNSSIVDSFIDQAGGTFPSNLQGFPAEAYDQYLIDRATFDSDVDFFLEEQGGRTYFSPNYDGFGFDGYSSIIGFFGGVYPLQRERIITSGSQYEMNIAYGANYDDRIYFGGALDIGFLNYERTSIYSEREFQFADGTPDNLVNSIRIEDRFAVSGAGVNLNLGLTVRPVNFVTVGISYQTPAVYALSEEGEYEFSTSWNESVSYVFDGDTADLGPITAISDVFISDYSIKTPGRLNAGVAIFAGKSGFITADVEYLDYRNSVVRSADFEAGADNDVIQNIYRDAINYRLGTEFRLLDNFRLRGGYSVLADPYANTPQLDRSITRLTGGLGYRNRDFFIDLAVINMQTTAFNSPYTFSQDFIDNLGFVDPLAESDISMWSSMVTLGFVF